MKATEHIDLLKIELETCRELLKQAEARLSEANTFMALARTFADEHDKHPWAGSTVYEAGQDLIKAIRELE